RVDSEELLETLADRAKNLGYDYVAKLFQNYHEVSLGGSNGKLMFERLAELVQDYNDSGQRKAVLQEYDAHAGKAFILCIITSLMCRVHEKVLQEGELCYVDALASFDPLNSSITLLYTSCTVGALPLGLFVTSDELEITPQIGLMVILTDDSSAERNALELWVRLLCTFHFLQAFWRWLYDSKHKVNKEDWVPIMEKTRKILYALSGSEMEIHYEEFKQKFYNHPQLQSHFELLWKQRSFGIMKDIIFARTKAYNPIQIFQFIITTMERFYERRVLEIAHRHIGHLRIAKRFLCPNWKIINMNAIQKTCVDNEFLVPSTKDANTFYIINSEIGVCSCPVRMTGAPCKHQGAVSMKYHLSNFNFVPSLTSNDCITYAYIALGYVTENKSFYASLHAQQSIIQSQHAELSNFISFLNEVKLDYQNADQALRTTLNKFKDWYNAAKSKSVLWLSSFLYDLNRDLDPMVRIKSGAHIRVQVESIKRRKTEGSGSKQRLPVLINEDKENFDSHAIPVRKKRKTTKKEHNLCKNILSNHPN
ncbi:17913_t:CDS:2, partial [Funneliformis caledonium]